MELRSSEHGAGIGSEGQRSGAATERLRWGAVVPLPSKYFLYREVELRSEQQSEQQGAASWMFLDTDEDRRGSPLAGCIPPAASKGR